MGVVVEEKLDGRMNDWIKKLRKHNVSVHKHDTPLDDFGPPRRRDDSTLNTGLRSWASPIAYQRFVA